MYAKTIHLINFRNYQHLKVKLNSKLNIFLGNNAQGKTNLLESIYIASSGKSFRTNKDRELIHIDKDIGYLGMDIVKEQYNKFIEVKFEKGKAKRVKINKVELDKISDMIGVLNCVVFSPEDLKIIKGSPGERRSFLDDEISQLKPRYRHNLSRYNKILYQRNNLLKTLKHQRSKLKVLDVWDLQLASVGAEIIESRRYFLDKIKDISRTIHHNITGGVEVLEVAYDASINLKEMSERRAIEEKFIAYLKQDLERDIEKGTTHHGPHRDDISLWVNGKDCRSFGSQGQQRTAALSLRLAEVELIHDEIGEYPVLLLDDVLSELDLNRRRFLISTFKNVQTIITSTDDVDLKEIEGIEKSLFHIRDGQIVGEDNPMF